MKIANVLQISAIALVTLTFALSACSKVIEEPVTSVPVDTKYTPTIPDGNRIIIHFGTSTQYGCIYSFTNCIWIGWGTELNSKDRLALQFNNSDVADQYFGEYFPLTGDYTVDAATAQALGVREGVIPAGFYPLRDASAGQEIGVRQVVFDPAVGLPAGNLFNPANPQDNVGQLHNLAVQVILNDHQKEIRALKQDRKALQKFLLDKAAQFLAEVELPVTAEELKGANALNLDRDFSDYAKLLNESRLNANDREILLAIFDKAVDMPVRSPEELRQFVNFMTEQENRLTGGVKIDNPKVVLSMVSILKNSRYFWFWKSITQPNESGAVSPERIPVWLADAIGAEFGGLIGAIVASALASEK